NVGAGAFTINPNSIIQSLISTPSLSIIISGSSYTLSGTGSINPNNGNDMHITATTKLELENNVSWSFGNANSITISSPLIQGNTGGTATFQVSFGTNVHVTSPTPNLEFASDSGATTIKLNGGSVDTLPPNVKIDLGVTLSSTKSLLF